MLYTKPKPEPLQMEFFQVDYQQIAPACCKLRQERVLLLEDSSTKINRCFVFHFTIARTYNVVPACAGRQTLQACLITYFYYT